MRLRGFDVDGYFSQLVLPEGSCIHSKYFFFQTKTYNNKGRHWEDRQERLTFSSRTLRRSLHKPRETAACQRGSSFSSFFFLGSFLTCFLFEAKFQYTQKTRQKTWWVCSTQKHFPSETCSFFLHFFVKACNFSKRFSVHKDFHSTRSQGHFSYSCIENVEKQHFYFRYEVGKKPLESYFIWTGASS